MSKQIQARVIESLTNDEVDILMSEVEESEVSTEEGFKGVFGCTRKYAESTPWFVGACFYDLHSDLINARVQEISNEGLYTKDGRFVMRVDN